MLENLWYFLPLETHIQATCRAFYAFFYVLIEKRIGYSKPSMKEVCAYSTCHPKASIPK